MQGQIGQRKKSKKNYATIPPPPPHPTKNKNDTGKKKLSGGISLFHTDGQVDYGTDGIQMSA